MSDVAARPAVTVVGGGLAGIAAALACADAGASVTLLEVRPRLGGAACSVQRDGLTLDNGQHVFLRCCTAYRGLLERLGATAGTTLQPRLDIPVLAPGGVRGRLRRGALPAPLHLARALAHYPHLRPAERLSAARAARALARLDPADPVLDRRSFGAWLDEHRQGPRAVEALWDLVARPTLNLPAREASLALAAKVFRTGLLDAADAGDVGWARVPLGALHDEAAQQALAAAGVAVCLRHRVEAVRRDGRELVVAGPAGEIRSDAAIVALPPARAAAVLPAGALERPEAPLRLGASPIVNLFVAYDRPVTDVPLAAGVRTPVQWVFDRTASSGLPAGQLLAVSLSAAEAEARMPADALRQAFVPALAALFPAARGARVEAFHVIREHHATFRGVPGSSAWRPRPVTRVPGLLLAGAWTGTGWPATMEGAVRSGLAAAAALAGVAGARPGVVPGRAAAAARGDPAPAVAR